MTAAPLRERAQAARNPDRPGQPAPEPARRPAPAVTEYTEPPDPDPEQVPVHIAWARVMRDVRAIAKASEYAEGNTRYSYRGVDDVLAAVANSVRRHGVIVMPVHVDTSYRDTRSSRDKPMRECTVVVTYAVWGPTGDVLAVPNPATGTPMMPQSAGESLDTGDKGTTKAMTIALRNLFLQGLTAPTGTDPEAGGVERGERVITPAAYAEEIIDGRTSLGRLRQIRAELKDAGRVGVVVATPRGEMALGALIDYVGLERKEGRDPFPDPAAGDDPADAPSDVDGGDQP